jgi:hypothetical protein
MAQHANDLAPDIAPADTADTENPLRLLSTKETRNLYRRARSIRTLCFFWLLAIAMSLVFIFSASPGSMTIPICSAFVVLAAAAFFGTWRFQHWGRILSIALCVAILPVFLWGTIFGILGLVALIGSKPLFGPHRFSQRQLREEMEHRKTNNRI